MEDRDSLRVMGAGICCLIASGLMYKSNEQIARHKKYEK